MSFDEEGDNTQGPAITKFDSKLKQYISKGNPDKRILELYSFLERHRGELKDSIENGKKIINKEFKTQIYKSLEKNLSEIIYINSPEIFEEKLARLYFWYKKNRDMYTKILQMKIFTSLGKDQKLTFEEEKIDDREYQEKLLKDFIEKDALIQHRTEIPNCFKPSNQLKDYQVKKIKPKFEVKKEKVFQNDKKIAYKNEYANPKEIDQFGSSMGLKSTFYSTFNTKTNKFYETTAKAFHQTGTIDPTQEVKGSYSFNKPDYNFFQLNVEKVIMQQKNKELAEKRSMEEIKKKMNEFGQIRSFYKSNIQKNSEIQSLIELYKGKIKKESENQGTTEEVVGELPDIIPEKRMHRTNSVVNVTGFKSFKDLNLGKVPVRSMSNSNIGLQEKLRPKVRNDSVKNLDEDDKIIDGSKKMKTITYHVKVDSVAERRKMVFQSQNILLSDAVAKEREMNKILGLRIANEKMCNFKVFDPKKEAKSNPLSGYDPKNYHTFYKSRTSKELRDQMKDRKISFRNSMEYIKQNFNEENYLEMRKTMSTFKDEELRKLKSSQSMKSRIVLKPKDNKHFDSISKEALDKAFLGIKSKIFPKTYLPRSGSGLLKQPEDILKKGRKRNPAQ